MKTWIVIAYRQYGNWSLTAPFDTRTKAARHAELYLENDEIRDINSGTILVRNSRAHIQDITYIELELPE